MNEEKQPNETVKSVEEKVALQCQLVQVLKNRIGAFLSVLLLKDKEK